jgi:hypothetical protein
MKKGILLFLSVFVLYARCSNHSQNEENSVKKTIPTIEKAFLYNNQYTLPDSYPDQQGTRLFQWDKIRNGLILLDSIQKKPTKYGILQNYKNSNGEAQLVKKFLKNDYQSVTDTLGVERYQSAPLYATTDSVTPVHYGRDGSLVKVTGETKNFLYVHPIYSKGNWMVPKKYVKQIDDTVHFKRAIFIDRTNQNIATLEKVGSTWMVRSMIPATTGLHKPPYEYETPLGIFVIQQKKSQMLYYEDGTEDIAGYAPYASRFSGGAHIHGIPVNGDLDVKPPEYRPYLGTTPRSHECVRTVTSHAEFIYQWGPVDNTIVFVFD